MTAALPRAKKRPRRAFAQNAAGVAAVEFAIVLPFAMLLMALVVYGGQLYRVQRKVSLSAATVANLAAQGGDTSQACVTNADLTQIFAYPNLILYPNNATAVQVVVSEISVAYAGSGTATGTVQWSYANGNGTARPTNQQLPVDSNIVSAFTGVSASATAVGTVVGYAILGEVQYPFQPYDLYGSVGAMTLHDSDLMIPRTAAGVTVKASCP